MAKCSVPAALFLGVTAAVASSVRDCSGLCSGDADSSLLVTSWHKGSSPHGQQERFSDQWKQHEEMNHHEKDGRGKQQELERWGPRRHSEKNVWEEPALHRATSHEHGRHSHHGHESWDLQDDNMPRHGNSHRVAKSGGWEEATAHASDWQDKLVAATSHEHGWRTQHHGQRAAHGHNMPRRSHSQHHSAEGRWEEASGQKPMSHGHVWRPEQHNDFGRWSDEMAKHDHEQDDRKNHQFTKWEPKQDEKVKVAKWELKDDEKAKDGGDHTFEKKSGIDALELKVALSNKNDKCSTENIHAFPYSQEHMWGTAYAGWETCGGRQQSPINIDSDSEWSTRWVHTDALKWEYIDKAEKLLVNNGYQVQVQGDILEALHYQGKQYRSHQAHFHHPSEHTVDGKHAPLEMHVVTEADDGTKLVVAVLFDIGSPVKCLEILTGDPLKAGCKRPIVHFGLHCMKEQLTGSYWSYEGSLTTPPCTENVHWVVMQKRVTMSLAQLETFREMYEDNARPVKSLNKRIVTANVVNAK